MSIELPVSHIKQAPGLCGAATAQMMLHFKGLASATPAVQLQIFTDIQHATTGVRPPDPQVETHECPKWPTQMCDKCAGEPKYTCWCSWPQAVTATLVARGLAVTETSHLPAYVMAAAERILDAVDRGFPPAVLVSHGSHWVTITGYETGVGPPARLIGGRSVTEIHLNDPYLDDISSMAVDEWFDDELTPNIVCGLYINAVVVIADAPPGPQTGTTPGPTSGTTPQGRKKPGPRSPRKTPRRPANPRYPPEPGPRRRSRAKR